MNPLLLLLMLSLILGCAPPRKPDLLERIQNHHPITASPYLAFLVYNPWSCLSCNGIVKRALETPSHQKLWADNLFHLYPGIRPVELMDTEKKLYDQGRIVTKSINDESLYSDIQEWASISPGDMGKPVFILYSPTSGQWQHLFIRDADFLVRLQKMTREISDSPYPLSAEKVQPAP